MHGLLLVIDSDTTLAWRKVLKDLIAYFREIQAFYEHKSKTGLKVQNVVNNTITPPVFLQSGGIDDALQVLREFQRNAINEANKSRDIENDVILALTGLRSDLSQKIKEIKGLSSDFKNSVTPEMEKTKRLVKLLQEGLGQSDVDAAQQTGRQDPYLLKLAVDRQIERQIDEESYLHQVRIPITETAHVADILLGISQSGSIRSRTRSNHCWRDSEVLQCIGRYPQT